MIDLNILSLTNPHIKHILHYHHHHHYIIIFFRMKKSNIARNKQNKNIQNEKKNLYKSRIQYEKKHMRVLESFFLFG